mmetsp:Transcript_13130/g.15892  ORF Transcript_13130/g.15892 Transcript_13130/m.15892 type:complete len:420 (-) Transcript_13130:651-1910(-)|eukprot:CAMPEP_0197847492 /NCGR_PEP_ID=MMETSP1438-20131217/6342_1 /TAXON_ID=1461541 /ORGANISM="Pterosperma sp., Strain CCMP1384" /LENGTH=419 /DNA_ID=CAMNT_0043459431 /DNA_START=97 /DNA_END=1356 /DNA_ORIENTATION=+
MAATTVSSKATCRALVQTSTQKSKGVAAARVLSSKAAHGKSASFAAGKSISSVSVSRTKHTTKAVAVPLPEATANDTKNPYEVETMTTWLLKQEKNEEINNELTVVLNSIGTACKQIASLVARAGLSNMTGLAGAENVQGEDQKKLDVISNDVFCGALRSSGRTGVIASEEEDVPVAVEETYSGDYVVVFDPLDGSSNIDAAVSTGSIFGIYESTTSCIPADGVDVEEACITNVCQPGNNLIASGYCMYSSSIIMVVTIGNGVYGFTLDAQMGEFVLTHDNIKIPESGPIYSFNEGNYASWSDELKAYMDSLKTGGIDQGGKAYSARYIGSLVGDFHRTLLYGGIYGYPGDAKNVNGKLRLLYECAPMSMIIEQAGGKGSTGTARVLDVDPSEVHQRVPFFVGSTKEVDYLESFMKKAN